MILVIITWISMFFHTVHDSHMDFHDCLEFRDSQMDFYDFYDFNNSRNDFPGSS